MAPPRYKLYTPPGSLFAFAPLVVSEYAGVSIDIESSEGVEEIIASKSPTGKAPILETKHGDVLVSSQAISRFIANLRCDTSLFGTGSFRDKVTIEDWTNWASQELELPVCVAYYMVTECIRFDEENFAKAKNDIKCALGVLESHFEKKISSSEKKIVDQTFLILPEEVTLADIIVACYLVYPFTLVFYESDLNLFPNVVRWFRNCMQQAEFISVLGKIKCGK